MHRVDVHILTLPDIRPDWFDQCIASLVNEPINLRVLNGVRGNLAAGRMVGFAQGTAEFVSWVDPDDWVEPGAFQACVDALDANPHIACVGTHERWVDETGVEVPNLWPAKYHHLLLARRACLPPPFFAHGFSADYTYFNAAGEKRRVDMIGYNWRQHPGQYSAAHRVR